MDRKFFNIIPSPGKTACLLLYGPIGKGEKEVSDAQVVAELLEMQQLFDAIDVRINSTGGEVFAGMAIFNAFRNSTANIEIYVDGVAASIAAIIALCGKPLYMSKHSRLMLHQVSVTACGVPDELRKTAEYAEQIQNTLAAMISEKCNMTTEQVIAKYFTGGDHWLTAQEALEMGLCDGIFDIDGRQPAEDASNEDIYNFYKNELYKQNYQPKNSKEMGFIDELKAEIPSLKDAADEQALKQRIGNLENEAAKVPALEAKVSELQNKLDESTRAAQKAYLNQAVSEGRIAREQVAAYEKLMLSDEASTRALIDSLPKKSARVTDFIGSGKKDESILTMSWDEIDKAGRLAELKNNYPDAYTEKFNQKFKK